MTRLKVVVFESADPEFFIAQYDLSRAGETPTAPGPSGLPPSVDFTTRLAQVPVVSIASIRGRARGVAANSCWPATCVSPACGRRFSVSPKYRSALFREGALPRTA